MCCPESFAKDYLIPFVGPAVSLAVALLFFWLAPRRQARRQLALELWQAFTSDEMQTSRRRAWEYLHGISDATERELRVKRVWDWATNLGPRPDLVEDVDRLQDVIKVFNFFSACEQCLRLRNVDQELLRALLGYVFARWSQDTVEVVRENRPSGEKIAHVTTRPPWLDGMPMFRVLCGLDVPPK